MPIITTAIYIEAPVTKCFDFARDVSIHSKTTKQTNEKVIGRITKGLLNEGDMVTWEATHFFVRQRLTAKVIHLDYPYKFIDVMVKGAFKSFKHTHEFFEVKTNKTVMLDTFEYKSPLGILGHIADYLFLEKYMKKFLEKRGKELKKLVESENF